MKQPASPPVHVIRRAEIVAARQPAGRCVKSLRGAVLFDPESGSIFGAGYNAPPSPFGCSGTSRCREVCRQICEHAEARAIDATLLESSWPSSAISIWRRPVRIFGELTSPEFRRLQLVHVKIGENSAVTPSGPPSCAACSKRILGVGFIAGVWLYETTEIFGLTIPGFGPPPSIKADVWRYYEAEDFHRRSLAAEGLAE